MSKQGCIYFRDYDPATGWHIESDPIGLDGGLDTYLYAEANPLVMMDPNGLDASGNWKCNCSTKKLIGYRANKEQKIWSMSCNCCCSNNPMNWKPIEFTALSQEKDMLLSSSGKSLACYNQRYN